MAPSRSSQQGLQPAAASAATAAALATDEAGPPPAKRARGRPRKSDASAPIDGVAVAAAAAAATAAASPAAALRHAAPPAAALAAEAAAASPPASGAKRKPSRRSAAALGPSQIVLSNRPTLIFKAGRIAELLGALYPNPPIPLDHGTAFQLLCAVLLSAQTTDKKVNECTPALFQLAPDATSMAAADLDAIQACIRQLGLAPTKARNLKAMSQILVEQHGGEVPASMEALEALPGVGHKTASVVMCQAFGQDAFPVDTHIHRLAQRWGLTDGRSVEQTEADLMTLFPQRLWKELHLQIIFFGREQCPAQRHDPLHCPICSWAAVPPYNKAGVSPLKPGQKAAAKSPRKAAAAKAGGAPSPKPAKQAAPAAAPGKKRAAPAAAGAANRGVRAASQG